MNPSAVLVEVLHIVVLGYASMYGIGNVHMKKNALKPGKFVMGGQTVSAVETR